MKSPERHSCHGWGQDTTIFPWKQRTPLPKAFAVMPYRRNQKQKKQGKCWTKNQDARVQALPQAQSQILPVNSAFLLCTVLKHRPGLTSAPSSSLPQAQIFKNNTQKQAPYRVKPKCPSKYRVLLMCLILHKSLQTVLWEEPCTRGAGFTNQVSAATIHFQSKKVFPRIPLAHSFDVPRFIEFGWIKGLVVWYMNSINI